MRPISFEAHCQRCHEKQLSVQLSGGLTNKDVDKKVSDVAEKFAKIAVRHPGRSNSAATARADLRDRLALLIQGSMGETLLKFRPGNPDRRFPTPAETAPLADRQYSWVNQQLAATEGTIFDMPGGCRYCHSTREPGRAANGLPEILPARILARWWTHARFGHDAHRMMKCESCHDAQSSEFTSDVLLPGIDTCLSCHNTKASSSARADCLLCHVYHDPVQQKNEANRLRRTLDEILGK